MIDYIFLTKRFYFKLIILGKNKNMYWENQEITSGNPVFCCQRLVISDSYVIISIEFRERTLWYR